jgi:hypothetical protein
MLRRLARCPAHGSHLRGQEILASCSGLISLFFLLHFFFSVVVFLLVLATVGGWPGGVWFRFHGMSLPFVACYHGLIGIAVDLGWFGCGGEFGFGFDSIRVGDDFP